jgi:hypothetical protein
MIGRKQDADELRRLYERNRAELVAVYEIVGGEPW